MAINNFKVTPQCEYRAVRWMGDNKGEIHAFLDDVATLRISDTPTIQIGDRSMLEISGYRCAIKQSWIHVTCGSWLLVSFSELDGTFALMELCPEEFEEAFSLEAKPGLAHPDNDQNTVYNGDGSILKAVPPTGVWSCHGCAIARTGACDSVDVKGKLLYPCEGCNREDKQGCIWVFAPERWK